MKSADHVEYRIALVLNGGVSLAVWMSGVVREIDLIRRASCGAPLPDPSSVADREHYATWQRILVVCKIRVVVDIIAGTSAGGLNGALLATSLACGTRLPDLKKMWSEKAALTSTALLRRTDGSVRGSVLSGKQLEDTLAEVVTDIRDARATEVPRPVTLFVTATALGDSGSRNRFRDSADQTFEVADHRRLYRFSTTHLPTFDPARRSFTPNTCNDFSTDTEALVGAGRASASFPAAFPPVRETPLMRRHRYPPDPDDLIEPPEPELPYLMDGGILDNAPIEPVIDEIGRRVLDGRVERVLAYVVPSNGVVSRAPEDGHSGTASRPTWVRVVGSALDYPRESDFRHDMEAVMDALGADRSRTQTSLALLSRAVVWADVRAELAAGAEALLVPYRASRIEASLRAVRKGVAARTDRGPELSSSPPGSGMAYREVSAAWVPAPGTTVAAAARAASWPFGISGARRTLRLLLAAIRTDIDGGRSDLGPLAEALCAVDSEITALEKEVTRRIEATARADDDNTTLIGRIDAVFAEFGVDELLTERMIGAISRYAAESTFSDDSGVDGLRAVLAAIEVVTGAAADDPEGLDPPAFQFVRLGPDVDSALFRDNRGGDKLYGTSLGHFGAFADATWRRCDYTWGRLDAAAHVAHLLELSVPTTQRLGREVVAAEDWPSPEEFWESTKGAGQDFGDTLRGLVKTRSGRAVLLGVARSTARLLGQQGWSMLRGRSSGSTGRAPQ